MRASLIQEEAHEGANIIFGAVIDEKIEDEIHVTVIATGFGERDAEVRPAPWRTTRYLPSGTPNTASVQAMPRQPINPIQPEMPSPPAQPVPPTHANIFGGKRARRLGMIVDDSTLDIPAFKRRTSEAVTTRSSNRDAIETNDELDIPVFLRKKSD